ncbi:reverse transcriptase domain-containing protein [Vairimorpha necatrix]|uniref:Reverse transcriptase domain-containing protein n=1 Tax=Vairimorpha necatrix TaxID=6039 RepID=A0AAX4JBF5_9MICR
MAGTKFQKGSIMCYLDKINGLSQRARIPEDVLVAFVINGLPENIGSTIMLNFPEKLSWSYIYNICSGLQWRKISAEAIEADVCALDSFPIDHIKDEKISYKALLDLCSAEQTDIIMEEKFQVFSIDERIKKLGEHTIDTGNAARVMTPIYRNGMSIEGGIKKKIEEIEELIDELNGTNTFTKLDALLGDHQIRISEKMWRRRPLDVEMQVLRVLDEVGLNLNVSKCEYRKEELNILEATVGENGIRIDDDSIKQIVDMPLPTSRKDLESFWGLINYCNRFLRNVFEHTEYLYGFLKEGNEGKLKTI